jgi:hypothetical protein
MPKNYLFRNMSIFDVLEYQKRAINEEVHKLDPDYLLGVSEQDLVASLIDQFRMNVPVLKEDEIYVADHGDTRIDVSQDPARLIYDRSYSHYVTGTRTIIAVPFEGDASFFAIQPQTYTLTPPVAAIEHSELRLTYQKLNQDGQALKREYQATVDSIRMCLGSLASSAKTFNDQLPSLVNQAVSQRKQKLLRDAGMVSSLGLQIKRREGAVATYSAPIQRRQPRVERPKVNVGAFKPEPTLPEEEYEFILSILKNMVRVMELSPQAFEEMGEEDLRTHFLVQLNAQYEGQATGETFNFQGKTDILIRTEGRNVFIAECGFWDGEKKFLEKIDQLLSYLSWRDTKTALLIFNRNVAFSDVVSKIKTAAVKHSCFKRDLGISDESTFRYMFHQPSDPNRELRLTVLAFDVPQKIKSTK